MRLLLTLLCLFIVAQLLGMYTGIVILMDLNKNPYVSSLVVTSDANEPTNAIFFILYVLVGAIVMVVLIRKFGFMANLFKLLEFMMIATSSSIVFYAFLRIVMGYEESTLIAIGVALLFSATKIMMPNLKNAAAIMATAGVGVIFGISLGLLPLILFLIMLSIYDFISVFNTKHMVEMANFIVKKELAFTVTAKAPAEKIGEKEQRIDLGTGDMIAPITLEVSAFTLNPIASVFVFFGAVISLALFLFFVYKRKMILPALPPIVLGMIISLLIGFVIGVY